MTHTNGNGIVWVNVVEFACKFNRPKQTVYKWIRTRYLIELGFLLNHSSNHRILIGVPRTHECYRDFTE